MAGRQEAPKWLPDRLRTDPRMIQACAEHDFKSVFAVLGSYGIAQADIARQCDITPQRVNAVLAGTRQFSAFDVIERIADGLHIPGAMLGLARRAWEDEEALPASSKHSAPLLSLAPPDAATDLPTAGIT